MQQSLDNSLNAERLVLIFICLHVMIWTLTPILLRHNLPMDSIEGAAWGHQLSWGYDKNPFLNGWLTALATYIDNYTGWAIYFFSQLSVAVCFWAIWYLAKKILSPTKALVSVLILEAIQYFNFHAIDFNDNTLELSLWALTSYFFYRALKSPTYFTWILVGVFAGFGMMAKYYTAILLVSMFLFLIQDEFSRKQLKTFAPYIGLTVFLLIILPHFIWLIQHNFITVQYVFERTNAIWHFKNHFYFPAQFALQQFETFFPAIFIFFVLSLTKRKGIENKTTISTFDKMFLVYVGLAPFLLTLLLSIVFGIKLRAGWGQPLLSLWPMLFLAFIPINISQQKARIFFLIIIASLALLVQGYYYRLHSNKIISSANFPGKEITAEAVSLWESQYHQPLLYVAGPRWLSGIISFYAKDHPTVFMDWDLRKAFWIKIEEIKKKGGVFIWSPSSGNILPDQVKTTFKHLKSPAIKTFKWHRIPQEKPITIAIALLPPEEFIEKNKSLKKNLKTYKKRYKTPHHHLSKKRY